MSFSFCRPLGIHAKTFDRYHILVTLRKRNSPTFGNNSSAKKTAICSWLWLVIGNFLLSGCNEKNICPREGVVKDSFECICSNVTSRVTEKGKVWEAQYSCASKTGPVVPYGAYLLEVTDPSAHSEGIEGETKVTVSKKCIVAFIYMGLRDWRKVYPTQARPMLKYLGEEASRLPLCQ